MKKEKKKKKVASKPSAGGSSKKEEEQEEEPEQPLERLRKIRDSKKLISLVIKLSTATWTETTTTPPQTTQ